MGVMIYAAHRFRDTDVSRVIMMAEPNDEYVKKATAHHRGGAGIHNDKRTRRIRTRREADRWARFDSENGDDIA